MERLTQRIRSGVLKDRAVAQLYDIEDRESDEFEEAMRAIVDKLAHYEDLEEKRNINYRPSCDCHTLICMCCDVM